MRQHRALGPARGSRGVEQPGRIVGRDFGIGQIRGPAGVNYGLERAGTGRVGIDTLDRWHRLQRCLNRAFGLA